MGSKKTSVGKTRMPLGKSFLGVQGYQCSSCYRNSDTLSSKITNLRLHSIEPGDDNDDYNVNNFINDVDIYARFRKSSDADTAANASKIMTGKASVWVENLRRESPEMVASWSKLKVKLVNRFGAISAGNDKV